MILKEISTELLEEGVYHVGDCYYDIVTGIFYISVGRIRIVLI